MHANCGTALITLADYPCFANHFRRGTCSTPSDPIVEYQAGPDIPNPSRIAQISAQIISSSPIAVIQTPPTTAGPVVVIAICTVDAAIG